MLIRLARGKGKTPQQTEGVWKAFERLDLPYGVNDKDLIRRALWAKLPVAERLQPWTNNDPCALCGVIETRRHVYGFCKCMPFAWDTLSKTSVPCRDENGQPLNPTALLADHPLLSLTTHGLIVWFLVPLVCSRPAPANTRPGRIRCHWAIYIGAVALAPGMHGTWGEHIHNHRPATELAGPKGGVRLGAGTEGTVDEAERGGGGGLQCQ